MGRASPPEGEDSPVGASVAGESTTGRTRRQPRSRRLYWAILGITVAVCLLAVPPLWYYGFIPGVSGPPVVEIASCAEGLTAAKFQYTGPEKGYLTLDYGTFPQWCILATLAARSTIVEPLFLHSSDGVNDHSIDSLEIAAPFALLATSPSLPDTISSGGNLTVEVSLQIPWMPGEYGLPTATVSTH